MLAGLLRLPLYLPAATAAVVTLAASPAVAAAVAADALVTAGTATLQAAPAQAAAAAGSGSLALGAVTLAAAPATATAAAAIGEIVVAGGALPASPAVATAVASGAAILCGPVTIAGGAAAAQATAPAGALTPGALTLVASPATATAAAAAGKLVGPAVDDPRHVVYGPVTLAQGVGRISAETGTTTAVVSAAAVTTPITAGSALSGPVRAYSEGTSLAVLHPYNDHVVKVGPLSVIVAGVELPAPGVGLTLEAFVADTDDMLTATALDGLTVPLEETDPGVSGQYDGTFQGADLAAAPTLAAAESGTPYWVHLRDATGSYSECYEAPWERTRRAEVTS